MKLVYFFGKGGGGSFGLDWGERGEGKWWRDGKGGHEGVRSKGEHKELDRKIEFPKGLYLER